MSPLYVQMHLWAATPFVWGQSDCALSIADWFRALHGSDPAAALRGTYHDVSSCQRATGWLTDPVAVVERCLDTVRAQPGDYPRCDGAVAPGDVGLIRAPYEGRLVPVGAIWLGTVWGCRAPDGVTTITRPPVIAAWSIGYED